MAIRRKSRSDDWVAGYGVAIVGCGRVFRRFQGQFRHSTRRLPLRRCGIIGIELCPRERILALGPKLDYDTVGGLHAPRGGIIKPYRFVFALVESARKNGIDPHTNFKAKEAAWQEGRAVHARYAVNAAGLFAGEGFTIKPRKADFSTTRERLERMLESGKTMILFLSRGDVITSFAGLRPALPPHRPLAGM